MFGLCLVPFLFLVQILGAGPARPRRESEVTMTALSPKAELLHCVNSWLVRRPPSEGPETQVLGRTSNVGSCRLLPSCLRSFFSFGQLLPLFSCSSFRFCFLFDTRMHFFPCLESELIHSCYLIFSLPPSSGRQNSLHLHLRSSVCASSKKRLQKVSRLLVYPAQHGRLQGGRPDKLHQG